MKETKTLSNFDLTDADLAFAYKVLSDRSDIIKYNKHLNNDLSELNNKINLLINNKKTLSEEIEKIENIKLVKKGNIIEQRFEFNDLSKYGFSEKNNNNFYKFCSDPNALIQLRNTEITSLQTAYEKRKIELNDLKKLEKKNKSKIEKLKNEKIDVLFTKLKELNKQLENDKNRESFMLDKKDSDLTEMVGKLCKEIDALNVQYNDLLKEERQIKFSIEDKLKSMITLQGMIGTKQKQVQYFEKNGKYLKKLSEYRSISGSLEMALIQKDSLIRQTNKFKEELKADDHYFLSETYAKFLNDDNGKDQLFYSLMKKMLKYLDLNKVSLEDLSNPNLELTSNNGVDISRISPALIELKTNKTFMNEKETSNKETKVKKTTQKDNSFGL